MLVGAGVFDVLKWVGLLIAAAFAIAFRATPRGTSLRVSLSLLGGVALALFLAFGLRTLGREVVIVKMGGYGPAEKTRGVVFSERGYALQNGETTGLVPGRGTLVVNDSPRELSLETESYGALSLPMAPTSIPPMSTYDALNGVDYIGPDEKPPDEVSSEIGFALKYWLRW